MSNPDAETSITTSQRRLLLLMLTLATLVKLFLALNSPETADSKGFYEFLTVIREKGGHTLYGFRGFLNNPFNFPPATIHLITAVGAIADATGLPFKFCLRALPSLADIGSFFVVWRLLRGHKDLFRTLFLLALCPTSILINGYEGNIDGLMIFFPLLSIWLTGTGKPLWLAGAAWAIGFNIKAVPLMFGPVFLCNLKKSKALIQFFLAAIVLTFLVSLPFVIQSPGIVKNVLGYASIYGVWGITKLAVTLAGPAAFLHWPYDVVGWHAIFSRVLRAVVVIVILVVSLLMCRLKAKPPLLSQLGLVIAIFLFLTPGFGVQYLLWLVPFVTAAGLRATLIYYTASSIYLLFAMENLECYEFKCFSLMLLCWFSIGWVIAEFWRSIFSTKQSHSALAEHTRPNAAN